MKLEINSIDLKEEAFSPIVEKIAESISEAQQLSEKRKNFPRYMTKKQAAEYCNLSFNSFQKLVKNGLRVVTVDGLIRVDKKDIDEFLEKNKI